MAACVPLCVCVCVCVCVCACVDALPITVPLQSSGFPVSLFQQGGFLLYVHWSDILVPGCPHKVTVTAKGDVSKVRVTGEGLKGGIAGHELKVFVDTKEAGPGKDSADIVRVGWVGLVGWVG